jgi:uncharacterized Fe-S cluster protein YjdI
LPAFRQLRSRQRKLFNLKRKPWIIPDEVDVATVVRVIDTCPSGALKYRHHD